MSPNYGYQLYQAQRTVQRTAPRTEIIACDAQRGRQAAAVTRGARRLARATVGHMVSRAYRRRSPSWA
jgi:hypothetical protein